MLPSPPHELSAGSEAVFSFTKVLFNFSHQMCMCSAILFFCMDSTVLPGLEASISGPSRTFKALKADAIWSLVIWLVSYFLYVLDVDVAVLML